MQTQTNNKRRARTRTLVQAGALIKLTGLFEVCNIQEGDDLQYDILSRDKAAVLIGIFLDAVSDFSDPPEPRQIESWRDAGIRFLKQRSAHVYYQNKENPS